MIENSGTLQANRIDIEERTIRFVELSWGAGVITALRDLGPERLDAPYLLPGFVDAHVHIESSMLPPAEFARLAVRHGTLGAVSDPHEIANVLGVAGVDFMLENALATPFHFVFGAPSCVPATPFETAGGALGAAEIQQLLQEPQIGYLSEMMNFPGVLNRDDEVLEKIAIARRLGMPVDGHAPGLRGEAAHRYAAAGISTDHECFDIEEAWDKIEAGMHILIREGSAARNFETLHPLIRERPDRVMLCSDDTPPDDLAAGHIDRLVARAVAHGHDLFDVLRCACLNPVRHYGVALGGLHEGDAMDAILVADRTTFRCLRAWLRGELVAEAGRTRLPYVPVTPVNRFAAQPVTVADLAAPHEGGAIRVIQALDGELITRELLMEPAISDGRLRPDPARDLLQLCVVNRYRPSPPAIGFIRGFGLRRGAIASSVAHDSHNIVAVGADQADLAAAINAVIAAQGGVAVAEGGQVEVLALPIAGLMSDLEGDQTAERYAALDRRAKELGSTLRAPFMTLSFMALLVIPELKLSDRGLFDGRAFRFVSLRA